MSRINHRSVHAHATGLLRHFGGPKRKISTAGSIRRKGLSSADSSTDKDVHQQLKTANRFKVSTDVSTAAQNQPEDLQVVDPGAGAAGGSSVRKAK